MLNLNEVKVGDRLKWHLSDGGYDDFSVTDGHGATVTREPYKIELSDEWFIDVKWDPGTTQQDGGYCLKDFVRWNELLPPDEVLGYEPCRCKEPDLVKNTVAGKEFLFCRICKRERPTFTF